LAKITTLSLPNRSTVDWLYSVTRWWNGTSLNGCCSESCWSSGAGKSEIALAGLVASVKS